MDFQSRKTPKSIANEKRIQRLIQSFDPKLKLDYGNREGWYYISRPGLDYKDREKAAVMDNGSAMFSDAAKRGHLVICWPIAVQMMESYDLAARNIMRHLRENHCRSTIHGKTPRERAMNRMAKEDAEREALIKASRAKSSMNIRSLAKEIWRDNLVAKSYFKAGSMSGFKWSR